MQKMIAVKNISYSINGRHILDGVSFRCTINERICIFGENGAGKSTLLKILCGLLEVDDGVVQNEGRVRIKYVPQEFDRAYAEKTIEEYIKTEVGETLFKRVFTMGRDFGYDLEVNKEKTCKSLSGGQQKILALSVAFAANPDFLLLDEPENHLDIVSRMNLVLLGEEFKGGIIFISHDRLVIDRLATKVGELARGKLHVSEGGYDDYIEMKMERLGGLQRQYDAETKRMKQIAASLAILKQKAIRGKETSGYHKVREEFEALKKAHKQNTRPDDAKTKINISQADRKLHDGKLICRMKGGMFKYESAKARTFSEVNLEVRSGDKIVLLGRNGSGKSTFLKCLTGDLELQAGDITWGNDIAWAYFDQHAAFDPELTPIEVVGVALNCSDMSAQAALGAMKFDTDRMKTAVKHLSGGERMRLRFAIAFGKKPDFLILDEPTNHIDEVTWEVLLQACVNSKSSILLVTHDHEFIEEFNPSVFWLIHDQKVLARHKDLDVLLDEIRT